MDTWIHRYIGSYIHRYMDTYIHRNIGEFRASAAGGDASPDGPWTCSCRKPCCQSCQFHTSNVSLVKTLEALTRTSKTCRTQTQVNHQIHAIQESRQILQTSSVIMSQEAGAASDVEFDAGQDPELWDPEEDEAEEMADFEEAHAPGGPPVEATVSRARKAATGNTPITTR